MVAVHTGDLPSLVVAVLVLLAVAAGTQRWVPAATASRTRTATTREGRSPVCTATIVRATGTAQRRGVGRLCGSQLAQRVGYHRGATQQQTTGRTPGPPVTTPSVCVPIRVPGRARPLTAEETHERRSDPPAGPVPVRGRPRDRRGARR